MKVRHHRRNGPSGRALQRHLEDVESDRVLNWGLASPRDAPKWINQPSAVALACNKGAALAAMVAAKVPTPQVTSDVGLAVQWVRDGAAVVGRSPGHRSGSGMWPCITEEEVSLSLAEGATHWLQCVEAAHEYRVHVVADRAIKTSEKLGGQGWVRSWDNGWRFKVPTTSFEERKPVRRAARRAVRSLGLDFGAVDVLVDADGKVYVLEVNTAPGIVGIIETSTFARYVEAITRLVNPPEEE